jgi:ABC-2 type transport system permease protein
VILRDLRDMLVIARREFLERVHSKWFVGITLLGPLGIVALVLVPALLAGRGEGTRVEIIDRTEPAHTVPGGSTGVVAEPLAAGLRALQWRPEIVDAGTQEQTELDRIRDKKINGFLVIPRDGLDGGKIQYRGDNGSSQIAQFALRQLVTTVVQAKRGERARIPSETLVELFKPLDVDSRQTNGESAEASGAASYWLGWLMAYALLLVIMIYAVGVMRAVVQEKTTRVMELMVATIKPRSLMTGKIVGVGGAGLLQFGIWLLMGAFTLAYRDQILGVFGRSPTGAALPALAFSEILVTLLFFLVGYFFYASMYAAVGAMVSSEADTQQVQMPIMLLLMLGFAFVTQVSEDPRGSTAVVLTMLPFWSALLMPMRYLLGGATPAEVALSLAVLVVSTALVARAAAKIYRVGVLMYGKRPGLQELIRWLRY